MTSTSETLKTAFTAKSASSRTALLGASPVPCRLRQRHPGGDGETGRQYGGNVEISWWYGGLW